MARSRSAILTAAVELLAEEGFGGVSVEAVAARSGAAKTTIYRHWPSRAALLADAFEDEGCCGAMAPSDTGDLRGDLRIILAGLAAGLASSPWCAALPSLVDAAGRHPELAEVHSRFVSRRRAPLVAALRRGIARGDLPPDTEVDDAVAALVGPLFYRRLIARQPIALEAVERGLEGALVGLGALPLTEEAAAAPRR